MFQNLTNESDAAIYVTSERVQVRHRLATISSSPSPPPKDFRRVTHAATIHTACAILANHRFVKTSEPPSSPLLPSPSACTTFTYRPRTATSMAYTPASRTSALGYFLMNRCPRVAPSREDTHGDGGRVNERRSLPSDQLPSWSSILPYHSIYGEELVC